jgi:hypothetical protein
MTSSARNSDGNQLLCLQPTHMPVNHASQPTPISANQPLCLPTYLNARQPGFMVPTWLCTCPTCQYACQPAYMMPTCLFACQPAYLPANLHACQPAYMPANLPICLPACLYACQPDSMPVNLASFLLTCQYAFQSQLTPMPANLALCLPACLYACNLPICL